MCLSTTNHWSKPLALCFNLLRKPYNPLGEAMASRTVLLDDLDNTEDTEVNPPGESGDSVAWERWSHVREYVEEVPGRAA